MINSNIYNFDKTSFIIGQIAPRIVVTRVDRYSKNKAIQSDNQE
jgi:hypothetical protein